jgi:Flp pilus assembly protein TadD
MVAIGIAEFFNRHFDEAVPRLVLSLEEFPHWATPYGVLAACYAHMGRIAEARAITHRFQTMGLVPKASQFRNPENRELFLSGLRLAMGETEG